MTETPRLTRWLEGEKGRIEQALIDWVRIPSISADPSHAADVRRSAEVACRMLADAGLDNVQVLETEGQPCAYGDWLRAGAAAPTVLIYGHHDVQPADPVERWEHPPFEPVVRDGELLGRGAIDDKGQAMFQIQALRGLLATAGALPVNVKVLLEGEEEVGSPNFEALLTDRRDLLRCDAVIVSDTTMLDPDRPSTCVGMRGMLGFDVTLRTATADLHSGLFGGAVLNAAHVAAGLVAALHDHDGRVTLPGFYDAVRPLTAAERDSLDAVPFDPTSWMATAGVETLTGECGHSTLERVWTRPTAEVVGVTAGATGAGMKSIVPATAEIGVTFRLVPDQRLDDIEASFRIWLDDHVPSGAEVSIRRRGGVAPVLTPVDHPYMGALVTAIERVWGKQPLYTREGGSGPEEILTRVLGAPLLFLGVGLPDDGFHAPNERVRLHQLWRGVLAAGELLHEIAGVAR